MLSYQHDYHAGNHADVLKHVALTLLIRALQRKPSAFRFIDAHAGSGTYDLRAAMAQRNREHDRGIARVLACEGAPPEVAGYLETVRAVNAGGALERYPGSPQIASVLLREHDQVELFELHPRAHRALVSSYADDPRVHVHRRDAYEGLVAVLPPRERRGIVLIDPSYEVESEFERVHEVLQAALRRWAGGVFALWYPLIRKRSAAKLVERLEKLAPPRSFDARLSVAARDAEGLRGSGMFFVNLPFDVDAQLRRAVPWLHRCLAEGGAGEWHAQWVRES